MGNKDDWDFIKEQWFELADKFIERGMSRPAYVYYNALFTAQTLKSANIPKEGAEDILRAVLREVYDKGETNE